MNANATHMSMLRNMTTAQLYTIVNHEDVTRLAYMAAAMVLAERGQALDRPVLTRWTAS